MCTQCTLNNSTPKNIREHGSYNQSSVKILWLDMVYRIQKSTKKEDRYLTEEHITIVLQLHKTRDRTHGDLKILIFIRDLFLHIFEFSIKFYILSSTFYA